MQRRRAMHVFGWGLAAATVVALVAARIVTLVEVPDGQSRDWHGTGWDVSFAVTLVVGVLVATKVPRNAVGWLMAWIGWCACLTTIGDAYATRALLTAPGSLPGGGEVAWLLLLFGPSAFGTVPLILLLFPTGRPPAGFRWLAVLIAADVVALLVAVVTAWPYRGPALLAADESIPGAATANAIASVALPLIPLLGVAAAVSVAVRYRRAGLTERQQLKWFLTGASLLALSLTLQVVAAGFAATPIIHAMDIVAFCTLPIAVGIAMSRYRLYDIDRLISRSVSYAIIVVVLISVYAAVAVLPSVVLDSESDLAVAAATLTAAAAFRPLRSRVQTAVERRFDRARYDAARTIGAFAARLRDEIDVDVLGVELTGAVSRTVAPSHVSLWRPGAST